MPKDHTIIGRFVHCADLHLGYHQYGLEERSSDFYLAFQQVIDHIIKNNIKLLVIAGDIFHKKDIKPSTLIQFETALERLDADVDVVIVEGNHDSKHTINKMSWLSYLESKKLVTCLSWHVGGIYENEWILIIGMPYAGAITKQKLDVLESNYQHDIKTKMPYLNLPFKMLMLHAGVLGQIPNTGNISADDLMHFKDYFDYIALGHIHKPYEIENFIFNPGSTENCSLGEANFNGGFYDATVYDNGFKAEHIVTDKRTMIRHTTDINDAQTYDVPGVTQDDILEITLVGECDKELLEQTKIHLEHEGIFYQKLVDRTTRIGQQIEAVTGDRKTIERSVINDLTQDQNTAELIIDIKDHLSETPETIYEKFETLVNNDAIKKSPTKEH